MLLLVLPRHECEHLFLPVFRFTVPIRGEFCLHVQNCGGKQHVISPTDWVFDTFLFFHGPSGDAQHVHQCHPWVRGGFNLVPFCQFTHHDGEQGPCCCPCHFLPLGAAAGAELPRTTVRVEFAYDQASYAVAYPKTAVCDSSEVVDNPLRHHLQTQQQSLVLRC